MEKSDEEQSVKRKAEKFLKIIKYKRFFSFLSGFLSGFLMGIAVMFLIIVINLNQPFPPTILVLIMATAILSIFILTWEINSLTKSNNI